MTGRDSPRAEALDVAEAALVVLEVIVARIIRPPKTHVLLLWQKSPLTNTGVGSNLCRDGSIECDAGIMSNGQRDEEENRTLRISEQNKSLLKLSFYSDFSLPKIK